MTENGFLAWVDRLTPYATNYRKKGNTMAQTVSSTDNTTPSFGLSRMEWGGIINFGRVCAQSAMARQWNSYFDNTPDEYQGLDGFIYVAEWRELYDAGKKLASLTRIMKQVEAAGLDAVMFTPALRLLEEWSDEKGVSPQMALLSVYEMGEEEEEVLDSIASAKCPVFQIRDWRIVDTKLALSKFPQTDDRPLQERAVLQVLEAALMHGANYVRFVPVYAQP